MRKLLPNFKLPQYGYVAALVAAGVTIGVVAIGQVTSSLPTNYVLEMATVVSGPASSSNLGSNVNVASGDVVRWVIYTGPAQAASGTAPALEVPETITGTVTLPSGFSAATSPKGSSRTTFPSPSAGTFSWITAPEKITGATALDTTFKKTFTIDLGEYFQCDPGRDTIISWDKIRFDQPLTWGTGLSNIRVDVKRYNGDGGGFIDIPIDAATLTTSFNLNATGKSGVPKSVDISSVPSEYRYLQFDVTFTKGSSSATSLASLNDVPIDVTWKGDQAQVCFEATAGTSTDLTTSATVFYSSPGSTTPSRSTGHRFHFTSSEQSGFGPTVLVAPLVNASGTAAQTVLLQSSFDMHLHTGDVSVYRSSNLLTPYSNAASQINPGADVLPDAVPDRPLFYGIMYSPKPDYFQTYAFKWDLMTRGNAYLAASGPTPEVTQLSRTFTYINPDGVYARFDPIVVEGGIGQRRLQYMRGSRLLEPPNNKTAPPNNQRNVFRKRNGLLSPVVNSSPAWLPRRPQVGYPNNLFPNYAAFRADADHDRGSPHVLFGGHDGMLHAFKVSDSGLEEAFAYIPYTLISRTHQYSNGVQAQLGLTPLAVDTTPMVRDVALTSSSTKWVTAVVGSLGRKSRGIFAVDVTTRYDATERAAPGYPLRRALWEYTNTSNVSATTKSNVPIDSSELRDLGEMVYDPPVDDTVGAEQIVRMSNTRWAAVVGNGINSHIGPNPSRNGTGRAVLYLFYFFESSSNPALPHEALWLRIPVSESDTELAFNNGLLSPRPFDVDADGKVDYVYAGDMKGNLWRFDVRNLPNVKVARLFKTENGKPILAAPAIRPFKGSAACAVDKACQILIFGTGYPASPLTPGPVTVGNDHAVYAIVDQNSESNKGSNSITAGTVTNIIPTVISESDLAERTLQAESASSATVRTVSLTTAVNYDAASSPHKGWRLNLWEGEQMITNPQISSDNSVLLTTGRYWSFQGSVTPGVATFRTKNGWLTQLDLLTGTPKNVLVVGGVNNASLSLGRPIYGTPSVLRNPATPNTEQLVVPIPVPGTSQFTLITRQRAPQPLGRLSWREIIGE